MAKCGMVLRHWGSRMLSDPIWKQVGSAASSCPTSSSAETNTETIKVCSCPRIRLLGQLYWTIFLFVRYLVCSLESCSADFVIFSPPFAFCAAQFSVFPKDVSILTIPSTSQTSKQMVFLITYLSLFLKPHHCEHSVWYLPSPGCFLCEAYLQSSDQALQETPYLWMSHAKPKKGLWFVLKTLEINS